MIRLSRFENHIVYWWCRCDCGTEGEKHFNQSGSCGCLQKEQITRRNTKHGYSPANARAPEYIAWRSMLNRCYNPNTPKYPNYGGRGIAVCDRWRHDFSAFLADVGHKPSPDHSLDRINNDMGYSPDNCRWATNSEQNNNRRPQKPRRKRAA